MKLIEKIKQDQVTARKQRAVLVSTLLTTLIGEAEAIGKNNGNREVTDEEVTAVIKKFIKGMDETIDHLNKAGVGSDQVLLEALQTVQKEKDVMVAYLPAQLTEGELRFMIKGLINSTGKDLGKIMASLRTHYAGSYDGKMASSIAKELIK